MHAHVGGNDDDDADADILLTGVTGDFPNCTRGCMSERERLNANILFLRNLPLHVSDSDVRALVSCAGKVVKVDLRKGFALVTYARRTAMLCAVRVFQGIVFDGRTLQAAESDVSKTAVRRHNPMLMSRGPSSSASTPSLSGPV